MDRFDAIELCKKWLTENDDLYGPYAPSARTEIYNSKAGGFLVTLKIQGMTKNGGERLFLFKVTPEGEVTFRRIEDI